RKRKIKELELNIQAKELKTPRKKKYVQTSLFEPISNKEKVVDLLNFINKIDLKSDIPEKIKQQLIELKNKIEKIS
ncbi:MAG: hypothetical protein ACFE9M_11260, partial [Promethearchaeota archaeon]